MYWVCVSVWHKWCAIVDSRAVVGLSHLWALNICCPCRAQKRSLLSWRKCTTEQFTCISPGPCIIVCGFLIIPFGSPLFWSLVRLIMVHSTDHTSCLLKFFCYIIVSAQEHQHVFLLTVVLDWFLCLLWNKVNSGSEGFTSLLWILSKGPSS